jgi:hypothetical protein
MMRRSNRSERKPTPWPPKEYRLPSTIEAIEAGRPDRQQELFQEPVDDSRKGRLDRLAEGQR